jgi:hypothetical protein
MFAGWLSLLDPQVAQQPVEHPLVAINGQNRPPRLAGKAGWSSIVRADLAPVSSGHSD